MSVPRSNLGNVAFDATLPQTFSGRNTIQAPLALGDSQKNLLHQKVKQRYKHVGNAKKRISKLSVILASSTIAGLGILVFGLSPLGFVVTTSAAIFGLTKL